MSLRFFDNAIETDINVLPETLYQNLQQEFINLQWDNTAVIETVEEQESIGSDKYNDIDVWVDATIADTTTGLKDTYDFLKFIFKDINHSVKRGLMYKFIDNFWIVHAYTPYDGLVQSCGVRRCNNFLRIIDPLNGNIVSFPCVVDYDMASPSAQTSRYIITPNNHATVILQGNDLSHRLLKTNKRFILGGRPFKLLAFQNAVMDDVVSPENTLLYLDLYLDEIHNGDDLEKGIADNGEYNYSIKLETTNTDLAVGSTGTFVSSVILNGREVERKIVWLSDNEEIITVDENGNYEVLGEIGETATIYAVLDGNHNVSSEIQITIVETVENENVIILTPSFDFIRQFEKIDFSISAKINGILYTDFQNVNIALNENAADYILLTKKDNSSYSIEAEKISPLLSFTVNILDFDISSVFNFKVVSMLG